MNLKDIRKAKGFTQQALADASGVFIRQIQKIEAGEIDIEKVSLKNGVAIAAALGVDPKDLMQNQA